MKCSHMAALACFCLLVYSVLACAETYTWVDRQGTAHFADDLGSVPKKYRKNVERRGDVSPENSEPSPSLEGVKKGVPVNAPVIKEQPSGGGAYDKNAEPWRQGLRDREAAMEDVKKQIAEIDNLLKTQKLDRDRGRQLVKERKAASDQFREMRKQYDLYVESARKAGVKVVIE